MQKWNSCHFPCLKPSRGVVTGVPAQWALKTLCTWPWMQKDAEGGLCTHLSQQSDMVVTIPTLSWTQNSSEGQPAPRLPHTSSCHGNTSQHRRMLISHHWGIQSLTRSVTSANPLPAASQFDGLTEFRPYHLPRKTLSSLTFGKTNTITFSKAIANLCATARPLCSIVQRTEASHCPQQVSDGGKGNISTNTEVRRTQIFTGG